MNIQKVALTAATASIVGLVTAVGMASAESGSTSLVDKLSQRFNLNKAEVQEVFNEERAAREAEHEGRYEARLTQAVKDGKLTEEQKTKILAKHKELQAEMQKSHENMQAERESLKDKTEAERQAFMEQKHEEMDKLHSEIEAWEKENNIPSGYLMGGHGAKHGPNHGPGGHF
jgi:hypothetical protein